MSRIDANSRCAKTIDEGLRGVGSPSKSNQKLSGTRGGRSWIRMIAIKEKSAIDVLFSKSPLQSSL